MPPMTSRDTPVHELLLSEICGDGQLSNGATSPSSERARTYTPPCAFGDDKMAPIELPELSSNWKRLQKRLQATTASKPPPSAAVVEKEKPGSLKRKRSTKVEGESKAHSRAASRGAGKAHISHRQQQSRKKQKMEEPASIGASAKQHEVRSLSHSVSMPNLKRNTILSSPKAAAESISVLAPSPHHPDIENEGISSTALPGKYIALDCEMVGTGPEPVSSIEATSHKPSFQRLNTC